MNYPNPCDTCQKTGDRCKYNQCAAYQKRYKFRQKQINGYANKIHADMQKHREKFVYEHPDIIREYLHNGPCAYCKAKDSCDTPRPVYWRWWDARIEWLKGVWGIERP